jgi:Tfp pilus assembly protein PilE
MRNSAVATIIPDKKKSGFNTNEFLVIFVVLFLIVLSIMFRYSTAVNKSETAQARKNLQAICKLEKTYFNQYKRYGDLNQIHFRYPAISHSFEYTINLDEDGGAFYAVAKEKAGTDPLRNNVPGDQQLTINQNGVIY